MLNADGCLPPEVLVQFNAGRPTASSKFLYTNHLERTWFQLDSMRILDARLCPSVVAVAFSRPRLTSEPPEPDYPVSVRKIEPPRGGSGHQDGGVQTPLRTKRIVDIPGFSGLQSYLPCAVAGRIVTMSDLNSARTLSGAQAP
jgi:hypothetical protein